MRKHTIRMLCMLAVGLLLLTGCGAGNTETENARTSKGMSFDQNNADYETAGDEDYETADNYDNDGAEASDRMEQSTNKLDVEKLIYQCNMELNTLDFESTLTEFQNLVKSHNGFVERESTSNDDYDAYYYESGRGQRELYIYEGTVRIPADRYDDFVNQAGKLGNLKSKTQNVTNVSQEYSDLSVELEVLKAQREDYLEMLKEAKSLSDIDNVVLISDRIASVETKMNQLKTRLNGIDNDVAYSYVNVTIQEIRQYEDEPDESFWGRMKTEVKAGWRSFYYGVQDLVIWFVANLPRILVFLVIVFAIVKGARHFRNAGAKKAATNRAEKNGESDKLDSGK